MTTTDLKHAILDESDDLAGPRGIVNGILLTLALAFVGGGAYLGVVALVTP